MFGFRDYLRTHDEAVAAYSRLKREFAERFKNDRHLYTEAKEEFIQQCLCGGTDNEQILE